MLTADHGSVPGRHFYGVDDGAPDRGYYNWYYGTLENDEYLDPQPALKPLVNTGNLAMSYSDSMVRAWLKDQSPAKVKQAVDVMAKMPAVSAVWKRDGDHFDLASPGAVGPDAVAGRARLVQGARPRSCSTPPLRSTAPT